MTVLRASREIGSACRLLGVFPLPAGLLLLPDFGNADGEERQRLSRGDTATPLPPDWAFFGSALRGDAARALVELGTNSDPVTRYNALVLHADRVRFEDLRGDDSLPAELRPLVAAVGYVHGLCDQPPALDGEVPPEVAAMARMVRAAHHHENGAGELALVELSEGVELVAERSPVFAAQLAAQRAEWLREHDLEQAIGEWRRALELSRDALLPGLRASLWVQLGLALQELAGERRELLLEVIQAYQEALHSGLDAETGPETWALVQNHLGLAYLSLPMRDRSAQLRSAIAVQSFREALTVYRPDTHPELWASTQLNLANALQYLPSSHPEENLARAVELYEEVLQARSAAHEPLGYARLLANQANALAHLGVFQPALEKLEEARRLFEWHGEPELARSVLEQVAAIHDQRQDVPADPSSIPNRDTANEE